MQAKAVVDCLGDKPEQLCSSCPLRWKLLLVEGDRLEQMRQLLQQSLAVGKLYRFRFRPADSFLDTLLTICLRLSMYCLILFGIFTFTHR